MSENYITLISIFVVVVIVVFIFTFGGDFPLNERIQFSILVILAATMVFMAAQLHGFMADAKLRQRPFVGLSEISVDLLSESQKMAEMQHDDELVLALTFENKGLSIAKIEYIKVKLFYAYLSPPAAARDSASASPLSMYFVDVLGPRGEQAALQASSKEVPAKNETIFEQIILLPQHPLSYEIMFHARSTKEQLFQYDNSRPAPIIVETEMKYFSLQGSEVYWHNAIYRLLWLASNHFKISSALVKSNTEEKPLHYTMNDFKNVVLHSQAVANPYL